MIGRLLFLLLAIPGVLLLAGLVRKRRLDGGAAVIGGLLGYVIAGKACGLAINTDQMHTSGDVARIAFGPPYPFAFLPAALGISAVGFVFWWRRGRGRQKVTAERASER